MPTVIYTNQPTGTVKTFVARWAALAQGDDGSPMPFSQYTDKSVQVTGVFGGATLRVEGSNNGTDWAALTDPQGNDLNITAGKIELVTEATLFVRPRVIGGDGTTSLSVHLLCKE
jgi:hypothetical protein